MMKLSLRALAMAALANVLLASLCAADDQPEHSSAELLRAQAEALAPLVETPQAKLFLNAAIDLPEQPPRAIHVNKEGGAINDAQAAALSPKDREAWRRVELPESFYYFTRYGSPLAFARPVEIAASHGFAGFDGAKVADFGFGSIGQLRLMASLGCHAHGVEVDPILQALYSSEGDTGAIPRSKAAGEGPEGNVALHFGFFPSDEGLVEEVGGDCDLFVSKNTLKKGYIHPDREADPRQLIDLGVSDAEFLGAVHGLLKPGGLFLIYNLHPRMFGPNEPFVPWSDGRSPFPRQAFQEADFEVLAFDEDDTPWAHRMAEALEWDRQMDLENDLRATWTLARKPPPAQ